jgi:hypothetical protein
MMIWFLWLACSGHLQQKPDSPADSDPIINTDDQDGDGFSASDDCNDQDASINPGVPELCDGVDNDCDGSIDEPDAMDAGTVYSDADGDGFGNPAEPSVACEAAGLVADNTDCNDADGSIFPGAAELCDGIDNDCDGTPDDGAAPVTLYPDQDGDGFGNPASPTELCGDSPGFVADNTDCNDGNAQIFPGSAEICDGIDQDCDNEVDEDGVCPEDTGTDDTGADDTGTPDDTASPDDSSATDDTATDTGSTDTGSTDTGSTDTGSTDTGSTDTGSTDTGSTDTGTVDTGTVDTGTVDTGTVDTGTVDTGSADSSDTGDTGFAVVSRTGTWTGPFDMTIDIPAYNMSDSCSTTITITIDELVSPPITGAMSCTFTGALAALGTQNGSLDGTITEPNADGTITAWIFSDNWTGTFTSDITLEGSFSGSVTYMNTQADYQGSFTATRQ